MYHGCFLVILFNYSGIPNNACQIKFTRTKISKNTKKQNLYPYPYYLLHGWVEWLQFDKICTVENSESRATPGENL